MLGARALSIAWGDTPEYWNWKAIPESRFPEVAELQYVFWIEITGNIPIETLSPNTTYAAYFVFKMDVDNCQGFVGTPVKVHIKEVDLGGLPRNPHHVKHFYLKAPQSRRHPRAEELPVEREDGWSEIEMGRYHVGVRDGVNDGVVLEMKVLEVERLNWKSGLVIQGIELCPIEEH